MTCATSPSTSNDHRTELERIACLSKTEYIKLVELEDKLGAKLIMQGDDVGYLNSRGTFEFLFSVKESTSKP